MVPGPHSKWTKLYKGYSLSHVQTVADARQLQTSLSMVRPLLFLLRAPFMYRS